MCFCCCPSVAYICCHQQCDQHAYAVQAWPQQQEAVQIRQTLPFLYLHRWVASQILAQPLEFVLLGPPSISGCACRHAHRAYAAMLTASL